VYLTQLEYLVGKEAFDRALLRYFDEWKFRHPDAIDFLRVMEKESGLELDWYHQYFIQLNTLHDVQLDSLTEGEQKNTIHMSRIGRMPMPLDILITFKDGSTNWHHVPLVIMHGVKPSDGDKSFTVHKAWPWTHPTYNLNLPAGESSIEKVEIDPTARMHDMDLLNNNWKSGGIIERGE